MSTYSQLEADQQVFGQKLNQANRFSQLIEVYSEINSLTSELLHTLIDHIVVHEKEEIDGEVVMRVDIFYRFIGKVGDPNGDDTIIKPTKKRNYDVQKQGFGAKWRAVHITPLSSSSTPSGP